MKKQRYTSALKNESNQQIHSDLSHRRLERYTEQLSLHTNNKYSRKKETKEAGRSASLSIVDVGKDKMTLLYDQEFQDIYLIAIQLQI